MTKAWSRNLDKNAFTAEKARIKRGLLIKREASVLALILALSIWVLVGFQLINLATADPIPPPQLPHIYIRSDGSVEPSNASIQRVGETYFFTENILDFEIQVQRDNVIIDGSDHILQGLGSSGIDLTGRSNVSVKNVEITGGFYEAFRVFHCSNITLIGNKINFNPHGMTMFHSHDILIESNTIESNDHAIFFANCTRIHISENTVTRNRVGVTLGASPAPSQYVAIIRNNITENTGTNNTGLGKGIEVLGGTQVLIVGNNIVKNERGIYTSGANCTINHNNFVNNAVNVKSQSCLGPWDDGEEGNYWSDYNGTDLNGDGIGDTPYVVETPWTWIEPKNNTIVTFGVHAQDNFPLIAPFNPDSVVIDTSDWTITLLTPSPYPSSPSPSSSATSSNQQLEPFTKAFVAAALLISMTAIGVAIVFYFKKRKR